MQRSVGWSHDVGYGASVHQGAPGAAARAVAAQQRFEWLRDAVRDEIHRCDVAGLWRCLQDEDRRTADKERALVMLAMLGSARAAALLEWYDARGRHWRVQLLHRLARRECRRRRGHMLLGARNPTPVGPPASYARTVPGAV